MFTAFSSIQVAIFLVLVTERLNEIVILPLLKPLLGKYPQHAKSAKIVVTLLVGVALGILFQVNLFDSIGHMGASEQVEIYLSAIVIGGGSNLLHDIWGWFSSNEK